MHKLVTNSSQHVVIICGLEVYIAVLQRHCSHAFSPGNVRWYPLREVRAPMVREVRACYTRFVTNSVCTLASAASCDMCMRAHCIVFRKRGG